MGGSTQQATTTSTAQIPSFLQPLMRNSANIGGQTLTRLNDTLSGATAEDLVAGFNPVQEQAQQQAINFAGGPELQAAQNTVGNIAGGGFVRKNTPAFTQSLQSIMQGGPMGQIDPETTGTLSQIAQQGGFNPQALQTLTGAAGSQFQLDPTAQQALQQSAGGDFMFGSPGFNEAVQASIRQARPSILSTFAGGGSGAVKGGLAQAAQQQAASDAFARLFDSERNRQLQASGQLGQFGLQGRQQQIGAAGQLGSLGLQDTSLRTGAAGDLGRLNLGQQQQRLAEQQQRLQATGLLGDALNSERGRQLQAAGMVPQMGLLGPEILSRIGGMQQQQSQQELTAPMNAQQMLMQAAMQGLPFGSLIGQQTNQPVFQDRAGGALGGALAGAKLGSIVPGLGTGIGAVGGGLLGAFF